MNFYRCGHHTDVFYDGSKFLEIEKNKSELEEYGLVTTSCSRTGITQEGFFNPKRAKRMGTLFPCETYRIDVKVITNHVTQKFNVYCDIPESGKQAIFVPVSMTDGVLTNKKYPIILVEKRGDDKNKIFVKAFIEGSMSEFSKKEGRQKEKKLSLWVRGKVEEYTFVFQTDEESWGFLSDKWKGFFRYPQEEQDVTQPRIYDMIGLKQVGNDLLGINQKHGYTEVSEIFPHTNLYSKGGKLPNGWWSEGEEDGFLLIYKQKENGMVHAAIANDDEEYEDFFQVFTWGFNREKCVAILKEGLERKTRLQNEVKIKAKINSLGLDDIKLKFPYIVLTKQDSIDAGNCLPGTEEFIKKHGIGAELHVADITEEMFANKSFKSALIKKITQVEPIQGASSPNDSVQILQTEEPF